MAKIIAGSSCKSWAIDLSKSLGLDYIEASIERFADEELRIQLPSPLFKEDVIIMQSTSKPANDHLMELLLLIDAAKRSGADRVIALVPYFGYSRQDRLSYKGGPISASLMATLLEAAGTDHLITLDLHSQQSFFKIKVQNIDPTPLFASLFKDVKDCVVVSPDKGSVDRAHLLSHCLQLDIIILNKSRKNGNTYSVNEIKVAGKHCILIDDIVDTSKTLCNAAHLLIEQGALSVEAVVTHAVLSADAVQQIENSAISKITITRSITHPLLPSKFHIIDVTPLLKKSLNKVLKGLF